MTPASRDVYPLAQDGGAAGLCNEGLTWLIFKPTLPLLSSSIALIPEAALLQAVLPSRVLSLDPGQCTPQVGLPMREAYRCPCAPQLTVCNVRATYLRPSWPAYSCIVSSQMGWTYGWGGTNPPEPALTAVTAAPSAYSTQPATARPSMNAWCGPHLRGNCDHPWLPL